MGNKAYSSAANRAYLRKRGIQAVIPVKEDQKKHRRGRGSAGGRPPAFDAGRYKQRNTLERCFAKLKQFRTVATRYDKREFMYQGTIDHTVFRRSRVRPMTPLPSIRHGYQETCASHLANGLAPLPAPAHPPRPDTATATAEPDRRQGRDNLFSGRAVRQSPGCS